MARGRSFWTMVCRHTAQYRVHDAGVFVNQFYTELAFVRGSIEVTPDDQSLWYYHQYLVLHLTEHVGRERAAYITQEIDYIKGLLEMDDDIKWIYEVLLEYALTLPRLESRQPTPDELRDLTAWLGKLKELDPMRSGRWKDLEVELSTSPSRVN